ncbi:sensor histidine kinase [Geofilum rubicundum]|uniref:histidine kinase n=1 Tax=Geofilum rubicundum JCM 15548 TaxID=1236989 RepID=A0A0E9LYV2_9BACT|nr:HAMP domain-containing sensor histidine kinase [Geofilum rubicundum]GAO30414.1 two-component sensor histidine kinase precursor [Geofilum rubicundum JCM 15548]
MSKPRKNKTFQKKTRTNPEVLRRKLENLNDKLVKIERQKDLMYSAFEKHVEYLTNFTSHDVKNAIQNMDSIVSSLDHNHVSIEEIDTIKTCLNSIRQSLNNFSNLVPNSAKREFQLMELFKAAELINRSELRKKKIDYQIELDKEDKTTINQPFHNILQVINNLMLNSIKALEQEFDNPQIFIQCNIHKEILEIVVCDNGCGIAEINKNKIFEMYFTTTNGSGIGLYHAKYSLEKMNGRIYLLDSFRNFKTAIKIEIPIKDDKVSISN